MAGRFTIDDEHYMKRALALAARGQGAVEPNPMVGCVLVRHDRVVGEGYHHRFGGPHAEVNALRNAGRQARGATCYVTLEPCCHHGKTPPCTEALIAAGVKRVIAAIRDPFSMVRGRGFRRLHAAGIDATAGLLADEARRLNAPYLKLQKHGRPWVILKWAQSIDGKIATRTGDSQWISSPASRQYAHRIRGRVDAVVVGVGTAIQDDPLLTCRYGRVRRVASRIVLDPQLRMSCRLKLIANADRAPTIVVTDRSLVTESWAGRLRRYGVEILGLPRTRTGLDLAMLLDELGRRRMTNIMIEGGGRTLGSFFDAGLADEVVVFVSPRLIGGEGAPSALRGPGPAAIKDICTPRQVRIVRCGGDLVYHIRIGG